MRLAASDRWFATRVTGLRTGKCYETFRCFLRDCSAGRVVRFWQLAYRTSRLHVAHKKKNEGLGRVTCAVKDAERGLA